MQKNAQLHHLAAAAVLAATTVAAGLISPALYGFVNVCFARTRTAFAPQLLGTLVQSVGSGAVFVILALACDKAGLRRPGPGTLYPTH